jgi:hypothetical protein
MWDEDYRVLTPLHITHVLLYLSPKVYTKHNKPPTPPRGKRGETKMKIKSKLKENYK